MDNYRPMKTNHLSRERKYDEDEAAFGDKVWKVATAPKPEPER